MKTTLIISCVMIALTGCIAEDDAADQSEPATIVQLTPDMDSDQVDVKLNARIDLSAPIDVESVTHKAVLLWHYDTGARIPRQLSYDDEALSITVRTREPLQYGHVYGLTVVGLRDLDAAVVPTAESMFKTRRGGEIETR